MTSQPFIPAAVFCNSGPLMAFGKLNRLDLLVGVYPQAQIPEAVYDEVVIRGALRNQLDTLAIRLALAATGSRQNLAALPARRKTIPPHTHLVRRAGSVA